MGDNGRSYRKLVKAIGAYTYNNCHAGAPWTGYNGHVLGHHRHRRVHGAPLLALMSMVPRPQRFFFFNLTSLPPK